MDLTQKPSNNNFFIIFYRSSLKLGFNTICNYIQNERNTNKLLVFIFHDKAIESLIDLLIVKCKARSNTKVYLLDKAYKYVKLKFNI